MFRLEDLVGEDSPAMCQGAEAHSVFRYITMLSTSGDTRGGRRKNGPKLQRGCRPNFGRKRPHKTRTSMNMLSSSPGGGTLGVPKARPGVLLQSFRPAPSARRSPRSRRPRDVRPRVGRSVPVRRGPALASGSAGGRGRAVPLPGVGVSGGSIRDSAGGVDKWVSPETLPYCTWCHGRQVSRRIRSCMGMLGRLDFRWTHSECFRRRKIQNCGGRRRLAASVMVPQVATGSPGITDFLPSAQLHPWR